MRLLVLPGVVLVLASCGGSAPDTHAGSLPDPRQLVVRISDLPPRYSLVPGETIPTSLESVLADPGSTGLESDIRRERVSGYQTSVWSPEHRRIECSVAVYRSNEGAQRVLEGRAARLRAFLAARHLGRPTRVTALGEAANAFRLDLGHLHGQAVSWRVRNVLMTCTTLHRDPVGLDRLMEVVSAQQRRAATALVG
jgi:hypothetical protein